MIMNENEQNEQIEIEYLYGINSVIETLNSKSRTIYKIFLCASSKTNPRLLAIEELAKKNKINYAWIEKGRLIDLSRSKENQGVVAEVSQYKCFTHHEALDGGSAILLDNLEDPQNIGAIIRSAEIFGFKSVLLPNKNTPAIYPSIVKASAGATEHIKIVRDRLANHYVKYAQDRGYFIVALDENGKIDINDLCIPENKNLLLVVGGEDSSIGQYILNCADAVACIKQQGNINSLNASVAAGVAMFALKKFIK